MVRHANLNSIVKECQDAEYGYEEDYGGEAYNNNYDEEYDEEEEQIKYSKASKKGK